MAIGVTLLGTDTHQDSAGTGGSVTRTYTIPSGTLADTVVRVMIKSQGYTISVSDGSGTSYGLAGLSYEGKIGADLTSDDTLTITFTPSGGGNRALIIVAFAITGMTTPSEQDVTGGQTNSGTTPNPITYQWTVSTSGHSTDSFYACAAEFYGRGFYLSGGTTPINLDAQFDANYPQLADVQLQIINGSGFYVETWQVAVGVRLYTGPVSGSFGNCSLYHDAGNLSIDHEATLYYLPGGGGTIPTRATGGVWGLAPRRGGFHIAFSAGGEVLYQTSPYSYPTFGSSITVAAGTYPRMVDDHHGRIWLHYLGAGGTFYVYSDGDGESATWSTTPVSIFSGGKHPTIAFDPRSRILIFAAYVSGAIKVAIQGPGDSAPGTAVTAVDDSSVALAPDDDTFHITPIADGPGRFQLTCRKSGAVVAYQSTDDGTTYKQVV